MVRKTNYGTIIHQESPEDQVDTYIKSGHVEDGHFSEVDKEDPHGADEELHLDTSTANDESATDKE